MEQKEVHAGKCFSLSYLYGSQIWRKPTSFMTFGELKLDFFLYNKENEVVSSLILKFN